MKSVYLNKNCYGCGVCAISCPTKAIQIKLNTEGFYQPSIISSQCVDCGVCVSVCSFLQTGIIQSPVSMHSYASWSLNSNVRRRSSSGGVTYEIMSFLITRGYKICAVRYNIKDHKVEHYIAESLGQLDDSYGSKYIQSYTVDGLLDIDFNQKYLVIGTPCMIDSFKRLVLRKGAQNNFIFIDFFCHGIPSYFLWQKYIQNRIKECGDIFSVSFRYKENGWNDSYKLLLKGKRGEYIKGLDQGDIFYKLFLGDYCLGKHCYHNCKFKMDKSSADIRVGDLWGQTYKKHDDGVSAVLALTQLGNDVLRQIPYIHLQEEPFGIVTEGQMRMPPREPKIRTCILKALRNINGDFRKERMLMFCDGLYNKIRKILTHPKEVFKNRFIK